MQQHHGPHPPPFALSFSAPDKNTPEFRQGHPFCFAVTTLRDLNDFRNAGQTSSWLSIGLGHPRLCYLTPHFKITAWATTVRTTFDSPRRIIAQDVACSSQHSKIRSGHGHHTIAIITARWRYPELLGYPQALMQSRILPAQVTKVKEAASSMYSITLNAFCCF